MPPRNPTNSKDAQQLNKQGNSSPGSAEKKKKFGRPRKRRYGSNPSTSGISSNHAIAGPSGIKIMKTHDNNISASSTTSPPSSSSAVKKVEEIVNSDMVGRDLQTKNRIVDLNILLPELQRLLCCQKCHGKVQFNESDLYGLGFKLNLTCTNCKQEAILNSSKVINSTSGTYKCNRNSVLAVRTLGHGHSGLSVLCEIMDLPQPVAINDFNTINEQLSEMYDFMTQDNNADDNSNTQPKEDIAIPSTSSNGTSELHQVEMNIDTKVELDEKSLNNTEMDIPINTSKEEYNNKTPTKNLAADVSTPMTTDEELIETLSAKD